jgi:hypothetical protein
VWSFTIEVGGDPKDGPDYDEGGFSPDFVTQFPKLEREIHVAAWAFLSGVASLNAAPPAAPPGPNPLPPPLGSGPGCLMMLVSCLLLVASVVSVVLGAAGLSALLGGGALAGYLARRRS